MGEKLSVSQVARLSGVGPDSIRHYERIGILPRAERSPSGYRLWNPHDVRYLKWIISAKRAGFTLRELADIFRKYRAGTAPCHAVRDLLQTKLVVLDQQIHELSILRKKLRQVIGQWNGRLNKAAPGEFVSLFDDLNVLSRPATRENLSLQTSKRRQQ